MNSASTRPALRRNPQLLPPLSTHHRSIRPPKPKDSLLLNRFSEQTLTVSSSFPFNTMISDDCTRKLKPHSGPPRRLTSRLTPQTGIALPTANATSSHTSLPSSRHRMALSTRTLAAILQRKSHRLKPAASTAFKLPSRTSIVKPTHSSSTHTSKTPQRKITSYGRSKLYHASNEKRSGPLNGATPHPLASPNA